MLNTKSDSSAFYTEIFWFACIAYILIYILFYPPIYALRDEGIYLALAQVFKTGTLFIEKTGIPVPIYIDLNGHHFPFYPPGNSLLLVPFTWFGLKAVYAMGLIFHILNTFLFKKMAALFDCAPSLAGLLFLCFPSFVFYSRTLMSDIPSLTFFLSAFYFYFKPQTSKGLAGFFFGLSLFFRVSNVIVILPFFAALCIKAWRDQKGADCLRFMAAAAPFAAVTGIYNAWLYGSPFLSGYSEVFTGVKNFSPLFLGKNIFHYLITLNMVYPAMLILFFFNKRLARLETLLLTASRFLFFGFYYFLDRYPQPLMDFVFGNRFFYPVIPFFILAFSKSLQNKIQSFSLFLQKRLLLLVALFLMLGSAGIHWKHQGYLNQQAAARDVIYKNTQEGDTLIYDGNSAELIQAAWGKRVYHQFESYETLKAILNKFPPSTDTYIALREVRHGDVQSRGALPASLDTLKKEYRLLLTADANHIKLYQLIPLEGPNANT